MHSDIYLNVNNRAKTYFYKEIDIFSLVIISIN